MSKFKVFDSGSIVEAQEKPSKANYVNISGVYYPRSSPYVQKINGRYYRTNSPLITIDYRGNFILKSEAVEFIAVSSSVKVKMYAHQTEPMCETEEGMYPLAGCITVDGKKYKASSKLIVQLEDGTFCLASKAVKLSQRFYGDNYSEKPNAIVTFDGETIKNRDAMEFLDPKDGNRKIAHKNQIITGCRVLDAAKILSSEDPSAALVSAIDFIDSLSGRFAVNSYVSNALIISNGNYWEEMNIPNKSNMVILCPKTHSDEMSNVAKDVVRKMLKSKIDKIKESCMYDAIDEEENTAEIINFDYGRMPGGKVFGDYRKSTTSTSFNNTGGMGMTFGVEIETSHGKLNNSELSRASVALVGDGSIGAGEYVTGVLHGDSGIDSLSASLSVIKESCFIDNRCSTHVHIGAGTEKCMPSVKSAADNDVTILAALVKLGTILEDELFSMCSPARHPAKKHCASIKKYKDINEQNMRSYLAEFVHGDQHIDLNKGIGRELNRWVSSRYKWLNLVHMLSASRQATVEFRIWDATLSAKKARYYVLISMAITKYAGLNALEILAGNKDKVTLDEVFSSVIDESTSSELSSWVEMRKDKFAGARAKQEESETSSF